MARLMTAARKFVRGEERATMVEYGLMLALIAIGGPKPEGFEPTPVAQVIDRTIPGPRGDIRIRIYRPHAEGERPIVLSINDLHWADPALIGLLEHLVTSLSRHPFALITAMRPGSDVAWPPHNERATVVSLNLQPLNQGATEELAAQLLADQCADPKLLTALYERSGGNPLFLHELAALAAFIHTRKTIAESQTGGRKGVDPSDLATVDIDKGKQYFNGTGKCNSCHSPTGDLAGVATRNVGLRLFERLMYPRGAKVKRTVTLPSGETVSGTRAYLDEFTAALRDAKVRERYGAMGIDPVGNTPEQFTEQIKGDLARWEKVVRAAGIRVE